MPCLSGGYNRAIGLLIDVLVVPASGASSSKVTLAPGNTFPALIDTGASTTCISPSVSKLVGLQPIGMRPMVSATQLIPVNIYLVDFLLPFGKAGFLLSGTTVMEFVPANNSPFQILIGRDIICRGMLSLSFDGHFTFCL